MPPEVAFADLQFIIEFVYRGEIDVSEAELQVSTVDSKTFPCVDLESAASASEQSKSHMGRKTFGRVWMKRQVKLLLSF